MGLASSPRGTMCTATRSRQVPARARITKARSGDRLCRAKCLEDESNNDVLQIYHLRRGVKIKIKRIMSWRFTFVTIPAAEVKREKKNLTTK